jgi:hypothetical protein
MRQYPTDYLLWAAISGTLFGAIGIVWLTMEPIAPIDRLASDIAWLAGGCALTGWVAHAIAVVFGVRLSGRSDGGQAADYAEPSIGSPTSPALDAESRAGTDAREPWE